MVKNLKAKLAALQMVCFNKEMENLELQHDVVKKKIACDFVLDQVKYLGLVGTVGDLIGEIKKPSTE
jgi:hypothetical protein